MLVSIVCGLLGHVTFEFIFEKPDSLQRYTKNIRALYIVRGYYLSLVRKKTYNRNANGFYCMDYTNYKHSVTIEYFNWFLFDSAACILMFSLFAQCCHKKDNEDLSTIILLNKTDLGIEYKR